MNQRLVTLGASSGLIAVIAGAFAAHALKDRLEPGMLAVFETGARYQMYHALAMILTATTRERLSHKLCDAAGLSFAIGTLLFSGSLYALALGGVKWLGIITPFGGLAFLAGWALLAMAGMRKPEKI